MQQIISYMDFNFKEIFTAFMILFAVIDIVGNIPIIIDLRKNLADLNITLLTYFKSPGF